MPLLWRENTKVHDNQLHVEIGYFGKPPQERAFRLAIEVEVESMTTFLGLESGAWNLKFSSSK